MEEEDCKALTFVTDGAANMIKAFSLAGQIKLDRINCACHLLNTCFQNFFNPNVNSGFCCPKEAEPILKLFTECRALITYLKHAYLYRRLSVAPVQACTTRWNSNIDMLDSIVRLYPELEVILREKDIPEKLPSPVEYIQAVDDFLRPLKTTTKALEGSKVPAIHLVVPHFLTVKEHLNSPLPVEHQNLVYYNTLRVFQVDNLSFCENIFCTRYSGVVKYFDL